MLALSFSLLFLACFEEGKRLHHAAVGVELRVQPGRVEPAEPEVRLHDLVPFGHLRPAVFGDRPQLLVVNDFDVKRQPGVVVIIVITAAVACGRGKRHLVRVGNRKVGAVVG